MDIQTGEPVGRAAHWDAGHDSYYEYLLKAPLLFPASPHRKAYEARFLDAAKAMRWNLTSRSEATVQHPTSHMFVGKWEGPWFANEQSHFTCFASGTLLLASRALARDHPAAKTLESLGIAILEGCRHVYTSTPTGIGPEKWSWVPAKSHAPERQGYPAKWVLASAADTDHSTMHTKPSVDEERRSNASQIAFGPQSAEQIEQAAKLGFYVVDPSFHLRPEYVESLFYAYRITGEQRYRDWAWEAFEAMERYCKTEFGYAALKDVMTESGSEDWDLLDEQESFWSAETLKYLWLTFSNVNDTKLEEWVFSTEGHPFRRRDDIPV